MKINTLDKITAAKVTALLSAAVVTASSMSGVTAYAEELPDAYNAAELAEEVLAPTVADPTKFDFLGNYILTHDELGSPDPQIINNGDGTYNIIMYVGQSVMFPVNNPWADCGIVNGCLNKGTVFILSDIEGDIEGDAYMGDYYADGRYNILLGGKAAGSAVVEVGVMDSLDNLVSNTVTVGLFVLPAVPGAQEPTLTQQEIKSIAAYEHEKEYFKDHTPENGYWITNGDRHF